MNTGTNTSTTQIGTNTAHAANLIRSATAPEMSAGVITANIPRKATMASADPSPATVMSFRKNESNPPMKSLSNGVCANEKPIDTHTIGTISRQ